MKKQIFYLVAMLCSFCAATGYAQNAVSEDKNILSIDRNKKDNTPTQINFAASADIHPADAQKIFEQYSGINDASDKLQLISSTHTKQNTVVDRYAQFYKGIKVEYSSFTLASKEDKVNFVVSNIYNVPVGQASVAAISEETALKYALDKIGAETYMWQDSNMERFLKTSTKNPDTTNFPKGSLVWIEDMSGPVSERDHQLHLAYRFIVYAEKPLSNDRVYVDATTGKILLVNSLIKTTTATSASLYSGTVSFETFSSSGLYYLIDGTRGANIYTYNLNHGTTSGAQITNATTTWPTDTAIDAHWGAENVYDYWWNVQGRGSFDGLNSDIKSFVHYSNNYNNAFWDGSEMIYGDGSGISAGGFDPLVSLDVCAHELGHAICQYTSDLVYQLESGGMNEGFSDIWGAVIENYRNPHEVDAVAKSTYQIGEEIRATPLRSMDNPNAHGQPDTYTGTSWYPVTSCTPVSGNDYCGVHTNSGVLNYWFYLIGQGGSGTNDLGKVFSVSGIGITKAADIAYNTELLLSSTADYTACRAASIAAATTLYGSCATEVIAVTKAWYAVGVGTDFTAVVPVAITGTTNVCQGLTTTLSDATSLGTWTSAGTPTATVVSTTGVVTGVAAGTTTITYTVTLGGCYVTTPVTVNASPSAITGTKTVCVGLNTTLSDAGGGTWSTANTTIATVVSGSGVVSGVSAGTATITYKLSTGCTATTVVTVNPLPSAISGNTPVCVLSTVTLSDAGGGAWSTPNTTVATVVSGTGVVTGVAQGTATVTYTLGTGCQITAVVTVNPLPSAISAGTGNVCVSASTLTLSDAGGGTWSTANTTISTVVSGSGVVSGVAAGTATITYKLGTGCTATTIVTVNPLPSAISGNKFACPGTSTTLSDAGGGAWTSSTSSVATVVSGTGVVTGVAAGTTTITYTLGTGCLITTPVTINPLPSAISANTPVCVSANITLSDAGGGTWTTANTTIATVVLGSGVVSGVAQGTATITYTLATGCTTTAVVTVNPLPGAITGTGIACVGLTTTLTDAGGGAWTTANTTVATVVSGTGVVTGVSGGTATITYTLGTGCATTKVATINPLPGAINGPTSVCVGSSVTLSDAGGGAWASSNTTVATIGAGTGIVNGLVAGTTVITYTLPTSCLITSTVTVNSLPGAITGTTNVCVGLTTALTDAGGGAWTSSNTIFATVSGTGVVTGVAAGTATITYTLGVGCATNIQITVNPLPAAISGTKSVCAGLTTTLSDAGGGTWSTLNTTIATVVSGTGVVSGVAAGTATITYALATGCIITTVVTVNPLPSAISGTTQVCAGLTTTLSDAGGGAWTSGTTSVATVVSGTGVVTGVTTGTSVITYTLTTGCLTTAVVTVDPLPSAITGNTPVCVSSTIALSDVGGGTWSTAATVASVVSGTGVVTGVAAGTATITYKLATGCIATAVVTVNPLPSAISGAQIVCVGSSTTLSDAGGGTWTSGNTTVATIGLGTGIANGLVVGTAAITYTLGTGCAATTVVTVNALPTAITGTATVCSGLTTTLSNAGGGTWSSSTTSVATVGLSTGVVTGAVAGTATITYNAGVGCSVATTVTVYPLPSAISGTAFVCAGLTTALTDAGGGAWTSGNTTVATIGAGTGIVNGLVAGTSVITYTLPTGCIAVITATVNPLPAAISGSTAICAGSSVTLSDAGGGTWTSSATSVATIGLGTGIVNALTVGSSTITYTLSTGCTTTTGVTVSIVPTAITGTANVCAGLTTLLSNGVGGGSWNSSNTTVATVVSGSGLVSGLLAGTTTITYSVGPGCTALATVTVNPLPGSISGTMNVCAGLTTALTDAGGGAWASSNTSVANVSGFGVVSGLLAGTTTITYTLPTGCITLATVTVNPLPAAISGTAFVCAGLTTTLTDAGGGTWTSGATSVATIGASTGVVFGVLAGTSTITYTLSTGCIITQVATVNPLPGAITGTMDVCAGLTTALTDAGGGAWTSSNTAIATVAGTGIVSGAAAGTATITYTLSTGCINTAVVTVNPLPATISGIARVCEGLTTTLSDAGGGTWMSSNTTVATIVAGTGVVSGLVAGTSAITYTLATGCLITRVVTVDPLPAAIFGTGYVCVGLTTALTDAGGGTWSTSATVATVGGGTGVVTGIAAGTATITYTLSTGCIATALATVNPLPSAISGTFTVCEGLTTALTDAGGGAWTSSNTTVATVSGSGLVSGLVAGTTTITYTLPTGCITLATVTVNPLPGSIFGTAAVCAGLTTALTDAGGGSWSSGNTAVATIDPATGVLSGILAGTSTVTYTLSTGCIATLLTTVNPLPAAITGTMNVCAGLTTALTDAGGGAWTSSNTTVASAGLTTGIISGNVAGTTTITYTLPTGCIARTTVTVNALPIVTALTGAPDACISITSALSDATPSGVWTSTNTSVATVSTSGLVLGVAAGTTVISYTVTNLSGCVTAATTIFTVHPPLSITATPASSTSFCTGGYVTLRSTTGSGFLYQWQVGGSDITGATSSAFTTNYGGNFNVVVTGTGICKSVSPLVLVTVSPSPIVVPAVSIGVSPDTMLCVVTSPTTFTPAPVNGGSTPVYQWSVNGTPSSVGSSFVYSPASGDIVSCRLSSNATCVFPDTAVNSVTMTISPLLTPTVSISASPGVEVCAGTVATYTAMIGVGGSAPSYAWNKNGVNVATGPSYTYTPVDGDVLLCTLTSAFRCVTTPTATNTLTVIVDTMTVNKVTIKTKHATIATGMSDTFTVVAPHAGFTPAYQWFVNGLAVSGATSAVFITDMLTDGQSVTCAVTSSEMCTAPTIGMSNSIKIKVTSDVKTIGTMNNFMLMPNPNKGEFTISGTLRNAADDKVNIIMTDVLGQTVYSNVALAHNGELSEHIMLSGALANGMYVVSVTSGEDHVVFHVVLNR